MMKGVMVVVGMLLASAAGAAAAESKAAKKFDAGPAIQGNAGPGTSLHGGSSKRRAHKKPM